MSTSNFSDSFARHIRGSQANPREAAVKAYVKRGIRRLARHAAPKAVNAELLEMVDQDLIDLATQDSQAYAVSFDDEPTLPYDALIPLNLDEEDYREELPLLLQASLPDYLLEALEANPDALSQLSLFEVKASTSYAKAFAASIDDEGPCYF